jgi:hypothetical protein
MLRLTGTLMTRRPSASPATSGPIVARLLAGDSELVFAENLLWHDAGRNQTSGDYRGREAVYGFFGKLMEITEGSFRADLHTVFADDEHGVALVVLTPAAISSRTRQVAYGPMPCR